MDEQNYYLLFQIQKTQKEVYLKILCLPLRGNGRDGVTSQCFPKSGMVQKYKFQFRTEFVSVYPFCVVGAKLLISPLDKR